MKKMFLGAVAVVLSGICVIFSGCSHAPAQPTVQPKAPAQVQPKAPAQVKPKAPAQVKPKAPAQVKPKAPAQVKPKAPAQVKPKAPAQVKPKKKTADPVWFTSMSKAQETARKENKVIFADFTGSDWCPWCVRLHDEVLKQPAFKEYAAKKLVLLLVDFPRRKVQTREQKAANNALAQKYDIRGFPTILILDANGNVLAKTGYRRGGAAAYVEHLKNILK